MKEIKTFLIKKNSFLITDDFFKLSANAKKIANLKKCVLH